VVYYEDQATGSIYLLGEISRLLRDQQTTLSQMPQRFRPLPYGMCLLLEHVEAIAANADEAQERT
jgi:hypothetical protein